MLQEALTYDDVVLEPQFSDIESRNEVNISNNLGIDLNLSLPIISAPMDTVSEEEMCTAMHNKGGLGILHRYNSIERQVEMASNLIKNGIVFGAAVGSNGDYFERVEKLYDSGVRIFCIDVAHGDHALVEKSIREMRSKYGKNIHIMAGNIATAEAFARMAEWGADSVRVGVGGGCFVPGTMVKTSSGEKKIEDVLIGDLVYTHTGNLQKVIDKLVFFRDEEIYSINNIECTHNHEFYVVDKNKSSLINEENINKYAYWVEASELDKEKHLLIEIED